MRRVLVGLVAAWVVVQAQTVRVATAANMGYALPALIDTFKRDHPDADIVMHIGGSGKLRAQIENGAPFDLFLSANTSYPEALAKAGKTIGQPVVYARGVLVLLSAKGASVDAKLQVLRGDAYRRIAVANPRTAPYGVAAVDALRNAGVYDDVQSKLVYGESISQTVIYTLKAADGGLIAKSAMYAPKLQGFAEGKAWVEVDASLYRPIEQGMALLPHAKGNPTARDFFAFLQSKEAKAVLHRFGYR